MSTDLRRDPPAPVGLPHYDAARAAVHDLWLHLDEFAAEVGELPIERQLEIWAWLATPENLEQVFIGIRVRAEKLARRMLREQQREAELDRMVLAYCRQRGLTLTPADGAAESAQC